MAVVDFVVAVRADQQQVLDAWTGEKPVQEVERRGVDPLQVVQKYNQRMFFPRECADETLEDITEPISRFRWIQRRGWGLFADNQLDLRYDFGQHTSVRAQRIGKSCAPQRQTVFALCEQLPDQAPERLRECTVRDVPDDLIELAGDEVAPLPDDRLVQLVNE